MQGSLHLGAEKEQIAVRAKGCIVAGQSHGSLGFALPAFHGLAPRCDAAHGNRIAWRKAAVLGEQFLVPDDQDVCLAQFQFVQQLQDGVQLRIVKLTAFRFQKDGYHEYLDKKDHFVYLGS